MFFFFAHAYRLRIIFGFLLFKSFSPAFFFSLHNFFRLSLLRYLFANGIILQPAALFLLLLLYLILCFAPYNMYLPFHLLLLLLYFSPVYSCLIMLPLNHAYIRSAIHPPTLSHTYTYRSLHTHSLALQKHTHTLIHPFTQCLTTAKYKYSINIITEVFALVIQPPLSHISFIV